MTGWERLPNAVRNNLIISLPTNPYPDKPTTINLTPSIKPCLKTEEFSQKNCGEIWFIK